MFFLIVIKSFLNEHAYIKFVNKFSGDGKQFIIFLVVVFTAKVIFLSKLIDSPGIFILNYFFGNNQIGKMNENGHIYKCKHDLTLGAKLNKRVEIAGKYIKSRAVMGSLILIGFTACKSEFKAVDADRKGIVLSKEVKELREQIAHDNYMGTVYIARKPEVDSAYLRKQTLIKIATDDELIDLTGDPNPVVSLTAFQGLYNRAHSVVPIIFNGYKSRTDHIPFVHGDLITDMPLLQYAYVYVMEYNIPDDPLIGETFEGNPKFELSQSEQEEVMKIIARIR